jgi:hypothetical protein
VRSHQQHRFRSNVAAQHAAVCELGKIEAARRGHFFSHGKH